MKYSGTFLERPLPSETTCLERPDFSGRRSYIFNTIEPVTKDQLSWKTTFLRLMGWSFKTGSTVPVILLASKFIQLSKLFLDALACRSESKSQVLFLEMFLPCFLQLASQFHVQACLVCAASLTRIVFWFPFPALWRLWFRHVPPSVCSSLTAILDRLRWILYASIRSVINTIGQIDN